MQTRRTGRSSRTRAAGLLALATLAALASMQSACGTVQEPAAPAVAQETPSIPAPPPGFEPMPAPEDNPMTPAKVALGRKLFFDKRLSGDGLRSCYSCHVCDFGLTDGQPTATGAFGRKLTRSSPTLWNVGYHTELYWDGRSPSLEEQALAAWQGGNMGAKPDEVVAMLNGITGYHDQFVEVFGTVATPDNVVMAIAAYERTLFCGTTPFDRFGQGETGALSESAQRGWAVWREKAGCGSCHAGNLFTDQRYHNVGIGMDKAEPDPGRMKVTQDEADMGAFKTPTLRDIAKSAPYFHDGSVATLEEAVDLMLGGGLPNPHLDAEDLGKVSRSPDEKRDLVEFLRSLSCECGLTAPRLPEPPIVM